MITCYFAITLCLAAFEPPEPANPFPVDDLLASALKTPLPSDRYGLLTEEDARQFRLINFFPKKTAGISNIKHQASLSLGNANLHLGDGSAQDMLEVPAWMHLLRYEYHNVPLPDDLAHEYQNATAVIALSDPNGSHVAVDGRFKNRTDRIPDATDLNVSNTKLDIHIEDSSARDYKLSGIISTAFAEMRDPLNLKRDNAHDLGGSIQWIRSFPSFFQLETEGSFIYREISKGEELAQSGNNSQLKASVISTLTDWAFSLGGLAWFSSLPSVRGRLLPQCEISWRVARLTGTALYFGGYFDDRSVGSELVERPYARMGDKLATNEMRKIMWEAWHSFGGWILLSFTGGYSEDRLAYQWIASNGFVLPKPLGRMRAWVVDPALEFTPTQSTSLDMTLNYRKSFAGEELNFYPTQKAGAELRQKLTAQLQTTLGERYYSPVLTGEAAEPQLPAHWESYAGITWILMHGIRLELAGENLTDNAWWEIPGRQGAGVTVRASFYAAF
jgi:hypothetical protein